jgi:hypothetical protein
MFLTIILHEQIQTFILWSSRLKLYSLVGNYVEDGGEIAVVY